MSAVNMSDYSKAMHLLIDTFNKYAKKDLDKQTLTKSELKELLQNELPQILEGATNEKMAQIIKDLDNNKDDEVNMDEFLQWTSNIIKSVNVFKMLNQK